MAKVVSAVFELKDKFTSKMKDIAKKNGKNLKSMRRAHKQFTNELKSMYKTTMTNIKRFLIIGVSGAVVGLTKYFQSSIKEYNEYTEQVAKLRSVIANTKGVTKEQTESLIEYANELERKGIIDDAVILAGTQQISTFQLQAESIKKLMPGLANLVAQQKGLNATTGDAVGLGNLIGKAMTGQTGALSRAGIIFSKAQAKVLKYGSESKRASMLAEVLRQNVGGVNEALAKTPEGQMKRVKIAIGNLKEEVGAKLQPVVTQLFDKFFEKMPMINEKIMIIVDKIEELTPQIGEALTGAIDVAFNVFDKFVNAFKWLSENWAFVKKIAGVFIGIYGAVKLAQGIFWIYQGTMLAVVGVQTLCTIGVGALSGALGILNAVMAANPVGAFILLLTTLFVVAAIVVKHFDKVKAVLATVWNYSPIKFFIDLIGKLIDKLAETFSWAQKVKDGLNWAKDGIGSAINGVVGFFTGKKGGENKGSSPIKQHALGTSYFKGGLTSINERGGEIVNLPNGTQIIPHDVSQKMIRNGSQNVSVNVTIQGNVIGEEEQMKKFANYIGREVGLELSNL